MKGNEFIYLNQIAALSRSIEEIYRLKIPKRIVELICQKRTHEANANKKNDQKPFVKKTHTHKNKGR